MPDDSRSSSRSAGRSVLRRRDRWMRPLLLLTCVLVLTVAGIWGRLWWEDRPVRLIATHLENEQYQLSLQLAEEYLGQHPYDSQAQLLKAQALSGLGNHLRADALFEKLALQLNGFPDDRDALWAWSVSLLSLQKWPQAIAILETLLVNDPRNPEILYRLTVARIRMRQYEQALESAQQLAQLPGHADQANVIVGTIHHDRGSRRSALDAWQKVLTANPRAEGLQIPAGEFFAMVGDDWLAMGDPARAIELLTESVRTHPAARTYSLLGQAHAQLGQQAQAVAAWETALRQDALDTIAREELANVALRNNQPQRVVELLSPLTSAGEVASSSAYLLQRAYTQLGKPEEAEQWQQRVTELREQEAARNTISELIRNSSNPLVSAILRSYQLAADAQWEEAELILNGLLLQNPDHPLLQRLADLVRQRGPLPAWQTLVNPGD